MGDSTDGLVAALDRASAILSVLLLVAFIVLLQRCLCRMRIAAHLGTHEFDPHQIPATLHNVGLNKETVNALPIFEYKSDSCKQEGVECAVCLSEFQENEKCRYLSNCNHTFHRECIDMWFYSHSTCPLCRKAVQPYSSSKVRREGGASISSNDDEETNGSVRTHLISGQTSSSAVQYQNPANVILWVRENEMDQGVLNGRH